MMGMRLLETKILKIFHKITNNFHKKLCTFAAFFCDFRCFLLDFRPFRVRKRASASPSAISHQPSFFFRDRIEQAFNSRNYGGSLNGERKKRGKNDSIFERLDVQFTFEQAMQHSVAMKGADVTHNTVRQMLKNWKKQGLVDEIEFGKFRKK